MNLTYEFSYVTRFHIVDSTLHKRISYESLKDIISLLLIQIS